MNKPLQMCPIVENNLLHLAENSSEIPSLGLIDGKLGLAMNLYYGARIFNNKKLKQYADHLIDDILNSLSVTTPPWFDHGLMGIGWGMLDLMDNHELDGNVWETFEEVDEVCCKIQFLSPPGIYNRDKGSMAWSLYLAKRLKISNDINNLNDLTLFTVAPSSVDSCLNNLVKLFEEKEICKETQWDIIYHLWLVISFNNLHVYPHKITRIVALVWNNTENLLRHTQASSSVDLNMFKLFVLLFLDHYSNLYSIDDLVKSFSLDESVLKSQLINLQLEEMAIYLFHIHNFTSANPSNVKIISEARKISTNLKYCISDVKNIYSEAELKRILTNGLWGRMLFKN